MKRMEKLPVMMSAADFIKEHDHLINVLRNAKTAEAHKEAERQSRELDMRLARAGEHAGNVTMRPDKMKLHAEGAPLRHMGY